MHMTILVVSKEEWDHPGQIATEKLPLVLRALM